VKKEIKNKEGISDVSFQEVEEHQYNFVSLRIPDEN
jgi:hypothetical protein